MEKHVKYATIIRSKIVELFNPKDENYISLYELADAANLTDFMHAIATLVPNNIYYTLANKELNNLEFNHLANQLVFQYSKLETKQDNTIVETNNKTT